VVTEPLHAFTTTPAAAHKSCKAGRQIPTAAVSPPAGSAPWAVHWLTLRAMASAVKG
jgi:hypothetical protein